LENGTRKRGVRKGRSGNGKLDKNVFVKQLSGTLSLPAFNHGARYRRIAGSRPSSSLPADDGGKEGSWKRPSTQARAVAQETLRRLRAQAFSTIAFRSATPEK
jgi:hypothetical protein